MHFASIIGQDKYGNLSKYKMGIQNKIEKIIVLLHRKQSKNKRKIADSIEEKV